MNSACLRIHHAAMKIFAEEGGSSITVSDVAREAGLSRGTVYNNLEYPESIFESVCMLVGKELDESFEKVTAAMSDPAEAISASIRLSLRRTHEEPDWGRFVARYSIIDPKIGSFWGRMPATQLRKGQASGRFNFQPHQLASVAATVGGATLGAMSLILEGHRTWRQAGSETAEFVLRGIGIPVEEAQEIAKIDLTPLPRVSAFD